MNKREVRSTSQYTKTTSRSEQWFGYCWFSPSNDNSSHQEALLYLFEDKEAMIKMIFDGKKFDSEICFQNLQSCLFDRINWEPQNQIK